MQTRRTDGCTDMRMDGWMGTVGHLIILETQWTPGWEVCPPSGCLCDLGKVPLGPLPGPPQRR